MVQALIDAAQWIVLIVSMLLHYKLKRSIQNCWDYMTDYSLERRINRVIDKAGSNYEQLLHQMTCMRKDTQEEMAEYDMVLKDHKAKIERLIENANTPN